MNILVLGSGAREHAICWALKKSKNAKNVFCIPGNAGIEKIVSCFDIDSTNKEKIYKFCLKKKN